MLCGLPGQATFDFGLLIAGFRLTIADFRNSSFDFQSPMRKFAAR
jgi:hypothetical protein